MGGPFWVYVLENPAGRFYVGSTNNLSERIKLHNPSSTEHQGSKYTHKNGPWELVYYEAHLSKADAERRERYFKTTKGKTTMKQMLRYSLEKHLES